MLADYLTTTGWDRVHLLLVIVPAALLLQHIGRTYWRLSHIPGPFLAKFTNLPRLSWVLGNSAHDVHVSLHRRYGPIVRFGPNMVSVADPAEIGTIYGFSKPWAKVCAIRMEMADLATDLPCSPVRLLPCASHEAFRQACSRYFRHTRRVHSQSSQKAHLKCVFHEYASVF